MELFDTFTEDGQFLGQMPRAEVHRVGIWHKTVNIFLFNSSGELLLQQRSAGKDVCPLLWDLSVAEHLQPGEKDHAAAVRGLFEELGMQGVTVEPWGDVTRTCLELPEQGIRDFELTQCFRGVTDQAPLIDRSEVAGVRYLTVADLIIELDENPQSFTPWFLSMARHVGLV